MMKMGQILKKKVRVDEKWKNNIFRIFSEKYGKMWKKVKNDENGWDIDKKGQIWRNLKKKIFSGFFSEKYGNMSKIVKNDENRSDIDEKGKNWWKRKK